MTTPPPPTGPVTPTVTVALGTSAALTTAQTVAVNVTVSNAATGSVVLSSGSYASFPAVLADGAASFTVPAGLLPVGADTLTATFTSSSASTVNNASGTTTATINAGPAAPTVTTTSVSYPTAGKPFRALLDNAGHVLVSVTDTSSSTVTGIQVFSQTAGGLTSVCDNLLRPGFQQDQLSIDGINFFNKGNNLVAAIEGQGVLFYTTAGFANCTAQGTQVTQGAVVNNTSPGSFDAVVTPDGQYAFVANEYGFAPNATTSGNVGVVSLQYDANSNVTGGTLIGQIATGGQAVAGVLLSPDGTRLYVTSEIDQSNNQTGSGNPYLARTGCVQPNLPTSVNGLLTVIDVAKAESSPGSSAIITTVDAGCSPVRSVETSDQSTLWVAARGDNRLLAFSTGMLESNAGNALLGQVSVGTQPVGLSFLDKEQLLAVANSARFSGSPSASIVSIAVPSSASVVQTIQTQLFPREFTTASDDSTLYLTNYSSNTLQVVSTTVQ